MSFRTFYFCLFVVLLFGFLDSVKSFQPTCGSRRVRGSLLAESKSDTNARAPPSKPKQRSKHGPKTTRSGKAYKNNSNNRRYKNNRNNNNSNAGHRRMNYEIMKAESFQEILLLLQKSGSLTKPAGGGILNSVNFSTALHRLARHAVTGRAPARAAILSDARFALLLACLGEALAQDQQQRKQDTNSSSSKNKSAVVVQFKSREISNIAWALAKMKLPPPLKVMPLGLPLPETSESVRTAVLQFAAKRKDQPQVSPDWIPPLSQLGGRILDHIGERVVFAINNRSNRQPFQMQEYASLLWAWATAGRAEQSVVSIVLNQMMRQQKETIERKGPADYSLRPQEWSNSIWAIAKSGFHQDLTVLEYLADLLETYAPNFANRFKPQEWSNTMWGMATLISSNFKDEQVYSACSVTRDQEMAALTIARFAAEYVTNHCHDGAASFKTQELSNTAWAFATLGFGLTPSAADLSGNNNYVYLPSDQPARDAELMESALEEILKAALPLLPRFRSQELNNLAWALARLTTKQHAETMPVLSQALEGIAYQLTFPRRSVTSQDIGTTLWALATLGFVNDDMYRRVSARLTPEKAHLYKPQELSNTVWALATAEIEIYEDKDAFDTSLVAQRPPVRDPVTVSFAIAARELMRRPHQFKSQEIKDVLWSYSKVGVRHPALFKSVALHLLEKREGEEGSSRLDEFSPQGLGNMAWAFARQAQLADDVNDRLKRSSTLANSNGRLAVYTTSYFDIGEALLQRFFSAIAEADIRVHNKMKNGKPQDLANTAWAFAVLGLKDVAFMEATKKELVARTQRFVRGESNGMTQFKGQELANILWALATLNISAGDILAEVAPYICSACGKDKSKLTAGDIAKVFKRQELANMAWACAVFGEYPPNLMEMLYTGLVGSGKEQDSSYMSSVHDDQGLQSQAIMTLIYVQAALDLSSSSNDMRLPENFPDGWNQQVPSDSSISMTETSFDELNLSTSKIQRSVSKAFLRIGLNHVEEHVITMEEMANEHGVHVPSKPIEILSIDIADVEKKIAIEVDGPAHYISRIDQQQGVSKGGYSKLINGKMEYQFAWNGDRQEMNGPTTLKQRLLRSLGWRVIHIPFWEWCQLGGESEEDEYCRRLLEQ